MKVVRAVALATMAGLMLAPAQAAICGQHDKMAKVLADVMNEAPRGLGMISANGIVEIFTSEAGTFTILITGTNGLSCDIGHGEGWQEFDRPIEGAAL